MYSRERCRHGLSKPVSSRSICQIHSTTRALNPLPHNTVGSLFRLSPALCLFTPKARHLSLAHGKLEQQWLNKYILAPQQSLLEGKAGREMGAKEEGKKNKRIVSRMVNIAKIKSPQGMFGKRAREHLWVCWWLLGFPV